MKKTKISLTAIKVESFTTLSATQLRGGMAALNDGIVSSCIPEDCGNNSGIDYCF
jgi:hypothetical protein